MTTMLKRQWHALRASLLTLATGKRRSLAYHQALNLPLGHVQRWLEHCLPSLCLLCAAQATSDGFCDGCLHDLPKPSSPLCPQCALPVPNAQRCGQCLQHPPAFDRTIATWYYVWPVDYLIQRYKYQQAIDFAKAFAQHMLLALNTTALPQIIIPMPLHRQRQRQRGFNQALELARPISKCLAIPLGFNWVTRTKATPAQAKLSRSQRQRAIRDAFQCHRQLQQQRVAIIDDVMTTGATANALAATLKAAGAKQVDVWVLARTLA